MNVRVNADVTAAASPAHDVGFISLLRFAYWQLRRAASGPARNRNGGRGRFPDLSRSQVLRRGRSLRRRSVGRREVLHVRLLSRLGVPHSDLARSAERVQDVHDPDTTEQARQDRRPEMVPHRAEADSGSDATVTASDGVLRSCRGVAGVSANAGAAPTTLPASAKAATPPTTVRLMFKLLLLPKGR